MAAMFTVPPLGRFLQFLDRCMIPIMKFLSGTIWEAPQQTHRWNWRRVSLVERQTLNQAQCCSLAPDWSACPRGRSPRFHMPRFGGWRDYVVLEPQVTGSWHVGWVMLYTKEAGLSRIELTGRVRMLLGPAPVNFFAIRASDGRQIPLRVVGRGRVGTGGPFAQDPLL